ncbi:phage tail assembly chaperone, partial [Sphingomonas sp. IC-56]|uniref:phage tail assembly chaperone n=1 Tax=Sphingomonas sp. IC-56 TaxID=2898529 RepID=UPI003FA75704
LKQGSLADSPLHHASHGPPPRAGEDFASRAVRLAGLAGLVFGWSPETFWNATPAELAALAGAARGEGAEPPGAAEIARLKELFPDG